jgi:hypothetical protein
MQDMNDAATMEALCEKLGIEFATGMREKLDVKVNHPLGK